MKNQFITALFFCTLFIFSCQSKENKAPENSEENNSETIDYGCESTKEDLLKIDELVGVLYNLNPNEESAFDSLDMLNSKIGSELETLLSCAANQEYDLENPPHLNITSTGDKRINAYSWHANNGGTWQMYHCVYQYLIDEKTAKTKFIEGYGGPGRFYQMEKDQPVYLGFGFTKTCSTCAAETAQLFTITPDSLKIETVMALDARMGSIMHFDYDEKSKVIHFIMAKDDINEEWFEDYENYPLSKLNLDEEIRENLDGEMIAEMIELGTVAIVDSMVWDGKTFVEK